MKATKRVIVLEFDVLLFQEVNIEEPGEEEV